jgi:hypothetical protein
MVVVVKVAVFAEAVGVIGGWSLHRRSVSDQPLYKGEREEVEGRRGEERMREDSGASSV